MTFFTDIIEILIFGSSLGLILAIISLGYSLVYGVGGVINLSHGMFYFLSGYLIFSFTSPEYLGLDYALGVFLGLTIITVIGALSYFALIKPFRDNEIMVMIATFALGFLIQQTIMLIEHLVPGYTFLQFPSFISGAVSIFGILFSYHEIFIMIISSVVIVLLIIFIKKSRFGKAIRAVSQDQDAAQLMGINIDSVLLFTVTLSAFLAGFAAFLYVPEEPLDMASGWHFLLLSMSVVILGGMGSIPGTVIGAFILSFATYICQYFIDPYFNLSSILYLIVIIVMLMIRPRGILGKKEKI